MAVGYACEHCSEVADPVLRDNFLRSRIMKLVDIDVSPASSKDKELEHVFLLWHHYHGLLKLCAKIQDSSLDELRLLSSKAEDNIKPKEISCRNKIRGIVNSTTKKTKARFSPQQELEDRLALMCRELESADGLESLSQDCTKFVVDRINSRSSTNEINPGIWKKQDPTIESVTDSPWELTCLTIIQLSKLQYYLMTSRWRKSTRWPAIGF
jgi:hypothetical protein